jgi:predicted acetylornithine/succinylornithine family transaminase
MSLTARDTAVFLPTYRRLPLEIVAGDGVHVITSDGTRYLDMFSGLAVSALGYGNPRVLAAITAQAGRYIHLSNYYLQEPQVELAEMLARHAGFPRVFFGNSGTEATEGAIKIARKWGSPRGRTGIIALSNGFHGRTLGALSIMDRPKYRDGFGPFLPDCSIVPFDDAPALEAAVNSGTAAIMFESIQGEGGIRPLTPGMAVMLSKLQQDGLLLIADEVQSGLGRTGRFFGFQHFGLKPDIVTMAKPIGGGLPLGAILTTEDVAAVMGPGMHGSTFGGNPVACAAGIATVKEIMERDLIANAARTGNQLLSSLATLQKDHPATVKEVRGLGLMVGMELAVPGDPVVAQMRDRGILINCTDTTVLRLLPPLIIGPEHVDQTCATLESVLEAIRP